MDCKFINQNDIHERFLLDRLTESEKSEYLTHLNSCESCKNKLDSEKELVTSVRHFGKSEMKSEIAKQVAEIRYKEKNISWDMILKVAAIFFFLVITPGLVYYYQSVEPPKISELYDFDEVVNQQKEVEKVEAEKDTEARGAASDKRRSNAEEKISVSLKSVSGAGAKPSVQSVGITKPVKKPPPRVETPSELEAEDDLGFEGVIPLPAAAKASTQSARMAKSSMASEETIEETLLDDISSKMERTTPDTPILSIPDLEKFVKPRFFQAADHEYFKGKEYSGNYQTYPVPATIYEMPPKENSIKTDKGIYRKKLEANQNYRLVYNINNKKIWINLVPLYEKPEFYSQASYPDSFPVMKKIMYTDLETLDFFVNEKIRNTDPAEISIYFKENKLLYLNILDEVFYQIDLNSDSTKAVIIQ